VETAAGESEPLCTLADGVQTLRLALAAQESQMSKQVVEIQNSLTEF
jgi:hypothetical protein